MNILHHKSWHVYSAKNREKVLKDEEEAAKEQEEKDEVIKKENDKKRLNRLRSLAKNRYQLEDDKNNKVEIINTEEIKEEYGLFVPEKGNAVIEVKDKKRKEKPIWERNNVDFNKEDRSYLKKEMPKDFFTDFIEQGPEKLFTIANKNEAEVDEGKAIEKKKEAQENYLVRKEDQIKRSWYLKNKETLNDELVLSRDKISSHHTLKFNDPLNDIKKRLSRRDPAYGTSLNKKESEKSERDTKIIKVGNRQSSEGDKELRIQKLREARLRREKKEKEREDKLLNRNQETSYSRYHPEFHKKRRY
ncbi:hypothetical protein K502DRAFT_329469 [Neoconidiobolus thromboides FSU 785]|nr:hypothetical protein K502DRAFT_329469 [Neoconidiobolus thromboides FSU 785]